MILGIVNWLFPLILTIQRRNFLKKLSSILMLAFNLLITPSMSSNLASAVSASLIDKATLLSIFWSWSLCCRSRSSPRPLNLKKVLFTKKNPYIITYHPSNSPHCFPNSKFRIQNLMVFWTSQNELHLTGLLFFDPSLKTNWDWSQNLQKFGVQNLELGNWRGEQLTFGLFDISS